MCIRDRDAAEKLEGKSIKLYAKGGQGGRLFGSVTAKEIAEEIKKVYHIDIDKRKIEIDGDIKAVSYTHLLFGPTPPC